MGFCLQQRGPVILTKKHGFIVHSVPGMDKESGRIVKSCTKAAYLKLSQVCNSSAQFSILTILGNNVPIQLRQVLLPLSFTSLSFVKLLAQYCFAPFLVVSLCW